MVIAMKVVKSKAPTPSTSAFGIRGIRGGNIFGSNLTGPIAPQWVVGTSRLEHLYLHWKNMKKRQEAAEHAECFKYLHKSTQNKNKRNNSIQLKISQMSTQMVNVYNSDQFWPMRIPHPSLGSRCSKSSTWSGPPWSTTNARMTQNDATTTSQSHESHTNHSIVFNCKSVSIRHVTTSHHNFLAIRHSALFFAGTWQWSSVLEIAPIFKGLVKMSLEFLRRIAASVAMEVTTPLFVWHVPLAAFMALRFENVTQNHQCCNAAVLASPAINRQWELACACLAPSQLAVKSGFGLPQPIPKVSMTDQIGHNLVVSSRVTQLRQSPTVWIRKISGIQNDVGIGSLSSQCSRDFAVWNLTSRSTAEKLTAMCQFGIQRLDAKWRQQNLSRSVESVSHCAGGRCLQRGFYMFCRFSWYFFPIFDWWDWWARPLIWPVIFPSTWGFSSFWNGL